MVDKIEDNACFTSAIQTAVPVVTYYTLFFTLFAFSMSDRVVLSLQTMDMRTVQGGPKK